MTVARGRLRKLVMTQLDNLRPTGAAQLDSGPKPRHEPSKPEIAETAAALRQLVRRVHFYAGLFVGPFLLVAAVSGFFYALSPSIEKAVYHDLTTAWSAEQHVPLADQVTAGKNLFPGLELNSVVAGTDGQNTRILFDDPSLPSDSYTRVAFVDPATGAVDGESVQYGSGQALPLRTWLSEMHRRLHLGEPGRIYSELAASWLAPITLFGLFMWWDIRRRGRRSIFRADKADKKGPRSSRTRMRTKHAVLGTWVAIGFLGLSATGLTWSTYAGDNVTQLRTALNWTTPTLDASAAGGEHADHGAGSGHMHHMEGMEGMADDGSMPGVTVDDVRDAAFSAGLSAPIQITPPGEMGEAWTAAETRRSYTAGPDTVAVDPHTGDVVERLDFAEYPIAAKLADWGIRAHMGFLFGIANQLLLAGVAAALVLITVRGYLMWWKRRPTRGGELPRMPEAGALWRLVRGRPLVTALGLVIVVGVGFAVPLLGISLAAFVVVDVAVQAVRRARSSRGA